MTEREIPIIIVGGVRYRKEDAARLGLTEDSGTKKAAPKQVASKKGAGNGGTVSGTGNGTGDADKPAGDGPAPITSSRQGK
jgi:hypothetical protein